MRVVDLPASRLLFEDERHPADVHSTAMHQPVPRVARKTGFQPGCQASQAASVKGIVEKECLFPSPLPQIAIESSRILCR